MKHIPPAGQSMILHSATPTCPCGPRKGVLHTQGSSGRSRHQGYKQTVTYYHNVLETA